MAHITSCALCLTAESQWFVRVFDEANTTLNMAQIISKYLWFDVSRGMFLLVRLESRFIVL